jgi:hypothetical protein
MPINQPKRCTHQLKPCGYDEAYLKRIALVQPSVGDTNVFSQPQHQRDSVFCRGFGGAVGRVDHRDAARRCRSQVDAVNADAQARQPQQLWPRPVHHRRVAAQPANQGNAARTQRRQATSIVVGVANVQHANAVEQA